MKQPIRHLTNLLRFNRGESMLATQPFVAEWEAINTCNARCKTCHDWRQKLDASILNTREAESLIAQLADAGLLTLVFSGGEPLLRRDLADLLGFAKSKDLATELITNGLLMTERRARKLVDSGVDVIYISLDAANPALNDRLRGLPGYFDLAMAAIDNLKSMRANSSLKIVIRTTVTSLNVQELVPLAELVCNKGIDNLHFQMAQLLANKNFKFGPELQIKNRERDLLIEQLDKLMTDFAETLAGPQEYYSALRNVLSNPAFDHKYRPLPRFAFVQIDARGNVFTSPAKTNKLGNIREMPFTEIWHDQIENISGEAELEAEAEHLFDATSTLSLSDSDVSIKRVFKFMRPLFHGARLF